MPTAEQIRNKTSEGTARNCCLYDAYGNPIKSLDGAIGVQLYHNGVPYQATGGGGSVSWPLQFGTPVTSHPASTGVWQIYAFSDGVASPNNVQTIYLMAPDGGDPFFVAQKTV